MKKSTGSCLCGQITYCIQGELRQVMACHCRQCRKSSGHYVAATQARTAAIDIRGQVSWYQSSPGARRGFCGICGSPLFWQSGDRTNTSVFAGSLDGTTGLWLTSQIHTGTKGDYYGLPDAECISEAES